MRNRPIVIGKGELGEDMGMKKLLGSIGVPIPRGANCLDLKLLRQGDQQETHLVIIIQRAMSAKARVTLGP